MRFDGTSFVTYDRLAGLPTSWVVAIAPDGQGGVFAATLRDGAVHVDADGRWQPMAGLPSPWTLSVTRMDKAGVRRNAGWSRLLRRRGLWP